MNTRARLAVLLTIAMLAALGCGSDFAPPAPPLTGEPASSIDKLYDIEAHFPHLSYPVRGVAPTTLLFSLRLMQTTDGRHTARVEFEGARIAGELLDVEDLSGGNVSMTIDAGVWRSGRIGPVLVDGVSFEFMIEGREIDGGWRLAGETWESQSALGSRFEGWRRERFLVAGSDFFAAGQISLVEVVRGGAIRVRESLATASSDPALRLTRDAVLVVNRFGFDNIQRLDPEAGYQSSWQVSVGSGANPRDVLQLDGERFLVSRYEPPFHDLAVLDGVPKQVVGSIPLASLAENPDGYPRADGLVRVGDEVFAALQDFDRTFSRYADGKLAVIDATSEMLVDSVPLPGKNPSTIAAIEEEGREKLLVSMAGIFPGLLPQELSGGVAVVDVANRVFERWAVDDDDLGGNVAGLSVVSPRRAYVIVSDASYRSSVIPFDPLDGSRGPPLVVTGDYLPEIAASGGGLVAIPDRDWLNPGLCIHRGSSALETHTLVGCARLALPPASVIALDP